MRRAGLRVLEPWFDGGDVGWEARQLGSRVLGLGGFGVRVRGLGFRSVGGAWGSRNWPLKVSL